MNSKSKALDRSALQRGAKWTALQPERREKHFVVHSRMERADGPIETVRLEALLTKAVYEVSVTKLADATCWCVGWH